MFGSNIIMNELNDEQLLEDIKSWNQLAFDVIFERWKDKIYSYLWTFLNYNEEDALDVSTSVFIKIYRYAREKDILNFKSFVYRTAHNEAINFIRLKKSEDKGQFNDDKLDVVSTVWWFQQELNNEYKNKVVQKLLKKLDEKYREVVYLYYFENKDYQEIAQIIWSNKNSIWTLLSRAKTKLQELIQKYKLQDDLIW